MATPAEELKRILDSSMPFLAEVISAYSHLPTVFTSGDLSKEAKIPRLTTKYYVNRMADLRMISRIPRGKKYQKCAHAQTFSDWLVDLMKLAIRPLEKGS